MSRSPKRPPSQKKKQKRGERSSKSEPSDFGNDYLSKRRSLKPELSGHNNGKVRVRVTDPDLLTDMYYRDIINDIQYSVGLSFIKDYWISGLAGKPAQNLEGGTSSGYHNYIPYGVAAMARLTKALDWLDCNKLGLKGRAVLDYLSGDYRYYKLDKGLAVSLVQALDLLEKFYQDRQTRRPTPLQRLRQAIQ